MSPQIERVGGRSRGWRCFHMQGGCPVAGADESRCRLSLKRCRGRGFWAPAVTALQGSTQSVSMQAEWVRPLQTAISDVHSRNRAPRDEAGLTWVGLEGASSMDSGGGRLWWRWGLLRDGEDAKSAQVARPDARQLSFQLLVLLQDLRRAAYTDVVNTVLWLPLFLRSLTAP